MNETTVLSKPRNKILEIISEIEKRENRAFTPTKEFYKRLGVGQIRFWMLCRNETQPTLIELYAIGEYFGIHPKDLF